MPAAGVVDALSEQRALMPLLAVMLGVGPWSYRLGR